MRTVRHSCPDWGGGAGRSAAFTIAEMVIVVAIVAILLALALPSAQRMWAERRIADTENAISGLLMTTRARAVQATRGQTGLFFFIDAQGVQRAVPIAQDPDDPMNLTWESNSAWRNVFTVLQERDQTLSSPTRVLPRYVVCGSKPEVAAQLCPGRAYPSTKLFSDDELKSDSLPWLTVGSDQGQRHRNFFTLVYSHDAELLVWRDVLIRDPDKDKDGLGDVTGLPVVASVTQRYGWQNPDPVPLAEVGQPVSTPLPGFLLADANGVALSFPSVDGLMVYDESLFSTAGDAAGKRGFLLEQGRPYYVHRLTGAVVRGPAGQNMAGR